VWWDEPCKIREFLLAIRYFELVINRGPSLHRSIAKWMMISKHNLISSLLRFKVAHSLWENSAWSHCHRSLLLMSKPGRLILLKLLSSYEILAALAINPWLNSLVTHWENVHGCFIHIWIVCAKVIIYIYWVCFIWNNLWFFTRLLNLLRCKFRSWLGTIVLDRLDNSKLRRFWLISNGLRNFLNLGWTDLLLLC